MNTKSILCIWSGILLLSCTGINKKVPAAIPEKKALESKLEAILKEMSLEEKIGQMTQLTLDVLTQGKDIYHTEFPLRLDEAMVDTVLRKYKVGSILNTPSNTPLTVMEWAKIIADLQEAAIGETGIPIIYGVDQIHGTTYTVGGTLFPQEIGMGATFNPLLVYEGAKITAYETKACNIPWNFSPVLDLGRDARWARLWETYGEDTYLVSSMGRACVLGYQGNDPNEIGEAQVGACLKHFVGYGASYSGKDRTPSYVPEHDLRERYFQPFMEAIRAGALSVMVNSGINNGLPSHADYLLITQWLKKELNWDGVVVTDWADINNLCLRDKICETKKEAVKLAINAGIDMSMVPYEWSFCTYLKELVEEGEVSMERIDDAVRRILRMKLRLNLFQRPYWSVEDYPDFGSEKHARVALKAAEESITLLKNEGGILPLDSSARVLVTGPNANSIRTLNGGWTLSWQGEKADMYGEKYNTILEALTHKIGAKSIIYEPGVTYRTSDPPSTDIPYWSENEPEIQKAVAAARHVDYILLCVGENSYCETPGNLENLTLSENQIALAKALAAVGKPIILILNEGRPRVIADIEPLAKGILHIYLPGNYGGDALANILYGDVNPSGKLPYTYPRGVNSLITYDHKPCESLEKMQGAYDYDAVTSVQWPFGYGLSYTKFSYSNLRTDKKDFVSGDILTLTVDVENKGGCLGKESVLLFVNDVVASLTPDVRRLRAFEKITLQPAEKKTVSFTLEANDLAFVGQNGKWILEKGKFNVQVANLSLSLNCLKTKRWESPNR